MFNYYNTINGVTDSLEALRQLGIPNEKEFIADYCARTSKKSIPNWDFYVVFSIFRMIGIAQGVYKRSLQVSAPKNQS
jgi:aminoglycoside phosphotransferase (APT) family kinase protein